MTPVLRGDLQLSKLKNPKNKKHLMMVLGLLNWFRSFLKNLSQKLHPITELLKNDKSFEWLLFHERILSEVTNEIKKAPRLIFPDFNEPFQIEGDASDYGIGGVVFQRSGTIGFYSRKLSKAELKHPIIEKKALFIIGIVLSFKSIIWGYKLMIKTDHSNLSFIHNSKIQRVQRWAILLNEYDYSISYLPGGKNLCADWLSRVSSEGTNLNCEEKQSARQIFAIELVNSENGISKKLKLNKEKLLQIISKWHKNLNHPSSRKLERTLGEIVDISGTRKLLQLICDACFLCQLNTKVRLEKEHIKALSKVIFHLTISRWTYSVLLSIQTISLNE